MATLLAAPFSLTYNSLIQARVQARNDNGWGFYSQVNVDGIKI